MAGGVCLLYVTFQMKIALSPDLHCFYSTYDRMDKEGRSARKEEWKGIGKAMLDTCIREEVDTCIFPGDYFVNPKPSAEEVLMVAGLMSSFKKAGIYVLGITGNHDVTGSGRKTMDDVVSRIGGKKEWCVSNFMAINRHGIGFAFLPYMKNSEVIAKNPEFASKETSEHLIEQASGLKKALGEIGAKKAILIGHWSIGGAMTSSGKSMERTLSGSEVILPLGELAKQGWDACMFGHIHVPQVLNDKKPFVAYSGSFQRINIGEAGDKRGFYIYDTDTEEHKFFPLPAIKMTSFSKDIKTKEDFDSLIEEIRTTPLEGRIAYVKYTVDKDKYGLTDKKAVREALTSSNPLSIAGIVPKVMIKTRKRDATMTEMLDNETALRKWLDGRELPKSRQERIMELYEKYSEKAQEQ